MKQAISRFYRAVSILFILIGILTLPAFSQVLHCDTLGLTKELKDTCIMSAVFTNSSTLKSSNKYVLYFGDGDSSMNADTSHIYKKSGNFVVRLYSYTTVPGCFTDSLIDSIQFKPVNVDIRKIPNVFTPNNDGVNDEFIVTNGKTSCVTLHLTVFSRWGEKVFETENREKMSWNGKDGNKELPDGVYFYVITGQGYKQGGSVTLIR